MILGSNKADNNMAILYAMAMGTCVSNISWEKMFALFTVCYPCCIVPEMCMLVTSQKKSVKCYNFRYTMESLKPGHPV